ncbi:hypothetical protein Tco_0475407 [Tanacetum coccineum]
MDLRIRSNDQYGVLGLKIRSIEIRRMLQSQALVLSSSKSLDTAYSSRMIRRIDDMKKQMVKLPTLTATEEAISDVLLAEHGDKKMPILLCGKGIAITGNDLDAFDSDCDEALSVSAVLMAKLFAFDSDVLSKVLNHETYQDNNVIVESVQEM